MIVWTEHNPLCLPAKSCQPWQTRCYRNVLNPDEAEQTAGDCPASGNLPADVTRFDDKAMTDANLVRVIADSETDPSDLADTEEAAENAWKQISSEAAVSDGDTPTKRWPWLTPGQQIFDCENRWWYCLRTKVTLHGIDQYEWLKTRQLRIAFQYTLPKWGNVLVSTLDRDNADEQAVKAAVNIIVQTVRAGRAW